MAKFEPSYLVHGVPGHPLHPPLTDITIGAYTFASVAGVLSAFGVAHDSFATAWWLALVVALASSALTIASGLAEWLSISRGSSLWNSATVHALVMAMASVFFVLAAIFGHSGYTRHTVTGVSLALTLVGFGALLIGGWLGGALTYVYGMRVLGLPEQPAMRAASPIPDEEQVHAAS